MSRAFVKETDRDEALPDRTPSVHPNFVTARGLAALESRVRELERERSSARERQDENALAGIARELRYYVARRDSARLVTPSPDAAVVRFGVLVHLSCADGTSRAYRIVGEDEADPGAGLLSYVSPLARALLGLRVGDDVEVGGLSASVDRLQV